MVEAILQDKREILPCTAYLEGQYGLDGIYVGVPVKLGASGVEENIEFDLTAEEAAQLKESAAAVEDLLEVMRTSG